MEKIKNKKDSPAKLEINIDKPTIKKSAEKIKHEEQHLKQYAVISPESVLLIADSAGITNISDEALVGISEDVSFKLREYVHVSGFSLHIGYSKLF